jgi:hypothetical protein
VQILANKKRLYAASQTLNEAVQTTLGMDDHEHAFKLAQQVSKAAKQVRDTASYLTHQQKQIEQQHPEFKEQARHYAQHRDAQQHRQGRQKLNTRKHSSQQQL